MDKDKVKKKKDEKGAKKIQRAVKDSAKEKIPDFLKINDIQILMPLEATSMHSDFTQIQLRVLLSLIEKLAYKLRETIEKRKTQEPGTQLCIFQDDEWTLNKDGEKIFRLRLLYKELGVDRHHYEQLENSLKALASLPISLPYKDGEGKSYQRFTNFCDVFIPESQKKNIYCLVDLKEDVANSLLKVDFGYHYVGKKASEFFGKTSKYCERIYWLIQSFIKFGSGRITVEEFRQRYGLGDSYKNFSSIRKKILDTTAEEIKRVYDLGACECWFEYREIYKGNKKKGEPYEIEFIIHKDDDSSRINKQLALEEKVGREKFEEILLNGLHLPPKTVKWQLKRLTDENCQAAISKALVIKSYVDADKKENPMSYIITSLNDFFENYKPTFKEVNQDTKDYRTRYAEFIAEICRISSIDDTKNIYSQMLFESYDDINKVLIITIPNREFGAKVTEHGDLVTGLLGKYFGEGIEIKFNVKPSK